MINTDALAALLPVYLAPFAFVWLWNFARRFF